MTWNASETNWDLCNMHTDSVCMQQGIFIHYSRINGGTLKKSAMAVRSDRLPSMAELCQPHKHVQPWRLSRSIQIDGTPVSHSLYLSEDT